MNNYIHKNYVLKKFDEEEKARKYQTRFLKMYGYKPTIFIMPEGYKIVKPLGLSRIDTHYKPKSLNNSPHLKIVKDFSKVSPSSLTSPRSRFSRRVSFSRKIERGLK